FTDIASYTIDSADTKCCDDGISFAKYGEGYALLVHVADISEMIKQGTEIDSEAFARVTAIYMAEGKIDMIPEEVSNDLFSLREGERRLCLTLAAIISKELEIINLAFVPSVIKVEKKCSYEEINEILLNDSGSSQITIKREELKTLLEFSSVMRQRRENNGAVSLFFPKADIYVENPGMENEHINISTDDHGEAGSIVSELMILYNSRAAELFNAFKAPALFKYSAAYPSPELVKKYREDLPPGSYDPLRAWEIRKSMPYSISAYEMTPHGMLGVPGYVQASSPLRRYIDLLMQRQMKSILTSTMPCYNIEYLKEKINYCEGSLAAASEIEQESRGYWLYKHLKKNMGEKIPATVIEASEERFRLELSKYYLHLNGSTRLHGRRAAGERVIVTIDNVDIRDRKIHFSIGSPEEE
ncbi:MAG TPA: ribonuclease catalytic domain-containing protein, partial [Candidatus Wallbacteria bacterium]|nr:ribonuclease catalytic domain-containing protein [Candidatus Wallbacteria bacterium]